MKEKHPKFDLLMSNNHFKPVLCFMNTIPFWGGGEQIYLDYILEFHSRSYPVCAIISKNSELHIKLKAHNISIPILILEGISTKSFLNPLLSRQVRLFLIQHHVTAFMCSTSQDVKLGGIAAYHAEVPLRMFRRGLAKSIKKNLLNKFIFGRVINQVIANSEETKRQILSKLSSVIQEQDIAICYNGIIIPKLLQPEPKQLFTIGNAGRLTEQKGQRDIIPIALELQKRGVEFNIQIAGTGELKQELQDLIQNHSLSDSIELIGFQKNIPKFMSGLDVFLMTSQWEGFGLVLAEAQLQEVPVVGYHITSNPEVVKEGETGFLVENQNISAIVDAIEYLYNNIENRIKMGKQAREWIIEQFEFQKSIDQLENLIQSKLTK